MLGWLLPRPAAPHNPARFVVPPELRSWLPQPLRLQSLGTPPTLAAALPLAVRTATTLLLACATQPLPLRADTMLRRSVLQQVVPTLAPFAEAELWPLCRWVWPLLRNMGLVAVHDSQATLAPAGQRWLQQPWEARVALLQQSWIAAPDPDQWMNALLVDDRGIDWPTLRRRLIAWAEALPVDHYLAPSALFPALHAACGPLADTHTHGFRAVDRVPWQPKRAAAVWDAALHGPLTWLGIVGWATLDEPSHQQLAVFRCPPATSHQPPATSHQPMALRRTW